MPFVRHGTADCTLYVPYLYATVRPYIVRVLVVRHCTAIHDMCPICMSQYGCTVYVSDLYVTIRLAIHCMCLICTPLYVHTMYVFQLYDTAPQYDDVCLCCASLYYNIIYRGHNHEHRNGDSTNGRH